MKDLQEVFESFHENDLNSLVKTLYIKNPTYEQFNFVWEVIISAYNSETDSNISALDLSYENMDVLFGNFKAALIVFIAVREGYCRGEGRIMLTRDDFNASRNPNCSEI